MASTALALLTEAKKHIGYHEGRDPSGNWNNKCKFNDWYVALTHNAAFVTAAWCDIFVSYCAKMSGNGDIIPLSAYVPSRLDYYRAKGLTENFPPKQGDIGFVMNLSTGRPVHIFMVDRWDAAKGEVVTVEGNTNNTGSPQGDGVYSLRRKDSTTNRGIVYARPKYAASAPIPVPPKPAPAPAPAPAPHVPTRDELIKARLDGIGWHLAELRKMGVK